MKKDIKIVFEDGSVLETQRGITVGDILRTINDKEQVIALRVNGEAMPTNYEIVDDAYINYIRITDRIGRKIYMKGLQYVYIYAIKELYGSRASVCIKHSLDKGIYTEIKLKGEVTNETLIFIKNKMKQIVKSDMVFKKISSDRDDVLEYVKSEKEDEKVLNYTYMTSDYLTLYELGDAYNYFYYLMPYSTKILSRFDLTLVSKDGILLSFPIDNVVPKYNPCPKVLEAFKSYENKLSNIGVQYAGDVNKIVIDGKIRDFIQINELYYDETINNIAKKVQNNSNIEAIFISGPSSSGKTTTSKKLALFLKAKGVDTLVLSTDNYFVERKDNPKKEDGSYEYEIVEALDIKLFNMQMKNLIAGKEVIIPEYNFITGEKEYKKKPISLKKGQVLIVEGLHAINEKLSSSIKKKNKLKIYISPFTPIGLDRHNHISTTDIRFLRRMVRDYQHRGYSASETLNNWMGMRASEENYVYPYQREADIIVNTSLAYEIGVLKTYAEPLLYSISKDSPNYEEAIRILNFLKGFINISCDSIPKTSILREFIGESYFE